MKQIAAVLLIAASVAALHSQTPAGPSAAATRPSKTLDREALEREFARSLTNVEFRGFWRMTSNLAEKAPLGDARPEKYGIESAAKEEDDYWIIRARIQYGENDVTLPVRVRVVWAEDTPIITVDEVSFPGLGTYSARVMVYRGFYSGAWFGANYGGVMSGEIVKTPE